MNKNSIQKREKIKNIISGGCFLIWGLIFILLYSLFEEDLINFLLFRIGGIFLIILGIISIVREVVIKGNKKIIKEVNFKKILFYDEILKDNPNNINILIEKGTALFKLERYQDAVECFNRVLELEPDNLEATAKKRLALEKSNNYNKVVK